MFSTQNAKRDDITPDWIFKNYFDIDKAVSIRFLSLFKKEKTPSMFIYEQDGNVYYKCFSTGKAGTIIDLFHEITGISRKDVSLLIHYDKTTGGKSFDINLENLSVSVYNYKVIGYDPRHWVNYDKKFWGDFGISLKTCEHHNIYPLKHIKIGAYEDEILVKEFELDGVMYGYADRKGFYKIYSPNKKQKFFSIRPVLQGAEQCIGHENLLITSSLKDIMSLKSIGITNIDIVAPPSETSYLQEHELEIIKNHYKRVITLFDNDTAGINMMINYRELYGYNAARLTLAKDPSDAVKYFGKEQTLVNLVPSIHNALYVDV